MAMVRIKSPPPVLAPFGKIFWKNARFHAKRIFPIKKRRTRSDASFSQKPDMTIPDMLRSLYQQSLRLRQSAVPHGI